MTRTWTTILSIAALAALVATPAAAARPGLEKASLNLMADRTAYEPGETARVAALLHIEPGWHVNSHTPTFPYLIPTVVELELPAGWPQPEVTYPAGKLQTFAFEEQPLSVYDDQVAIEGRVTVPAGTPTGTAAVTAHLTYQACNDSQCLPPVTTEAHLGLSVGGGGEAANTAVFNADGTLAAGAGAPAGTGGRSLVAILLLAVVGGLILNAMPCVLPVLSLKVFGMVKSAGAGRAAVTSGSLATAAGILASFLALGLAAVAAKAAGSAVGWGIQFQNPVFVTFLTVIIVLFCLNLWGLFEIPLPAALARVGGSGPREGAAGHFASGLFATLMATPCSAPFLGTAMGFALGQTAPVILAVFFAVGLGMSLPYLLMAAAPRTAQLLPKPGAWMETLKGVMGFLLAAAAIWLLYVLSAQISPVRLAFIELGLVGLALFTWLRHRSRAGGATKRLALVGVVAAVVVTLVLPYGGAGADAGRRNGEEAAGLIEWTAFDRSQAESLAAEGRLVFVDVTADWCFTCKFNEKLVLNTREVADAFDRHGVVPMKADWTNRNQEIGDYLAEFDRYGIPFYVLYRPGDEPHVFSELLTKEAVLAVLREAAPAAVARNTSVS